MYIPAWLLFFLKRFGSALVPFSNNLFYYWLVPLLSNPVSLRSPFISASLKYSTHPRTYSWYFFSRISLLMPLFLSVSSLILFFILATDFGCTLNLHLLQLIPSSYWTSTCSAALSLTIAWCDFCSSDQRFASTFLQIPLTLIMVIAMNRTPLVLAVSFPLLGRIRNLHPLATCTARCTEKRTDCPNGQPVLFISLHL